MSTVCVENPIVLDCQGTLMRARRNYCYNHISKYTKSLNVSLMHGYNRCQNYRLMYNQIIY